MVDLCPLGCFKLFPSWWCMVTPPLLLVLWCWLHVAAPCWCPSLSVCLSLFPVCFSLGPCPGVSHFPGLLCLYPLPILLLLFCHCHCVLDKREHL